MVEICINTLPQSVPLTVLLSCCILKKRSIERSQQHQSIISISSFYYYQPTKQQLFFSKQFLYKFYVEPIKVSSKRIITGQTGKKGTICYLTKSFRQRNHFIYNIKVENKAC